MLEVREWVLIVILIFAVINDLIDYRIPNYLIIIGWGVSFLFNIYNHSLIDWGIGIGIPILMFAILFAFKVLGAGDIKLFSVVGGFVGISTLWEVLFISFFIGGVYSVLKMVFYRNLTKRIHNLVCNFKNIIIYKTSNTYIGNLYDCNKSEKICFSPCICIAVICTVVL